MASDVSREQPPETGSSEGATGEMESGQTEEEEVVVKKPTSPNTTTSATQRAPSDNLEAEVHVSAEHRDKLGATTTAQTPDDAMISRDGLASADVDDQFSPSVSRPPPDGHEFPPIFAEDPMNRSLPPVPQQQQQQQQEPLATEEQDAKGQPNAPPCHVISVALAELPSKRDDPHAQQRPTPNREGPQETGPLASRSADTANEDSTAGVRHVTNGDDEQSALNGTDDPSPSLNDDPTLRKDHNGAIDADEKMNVGANPQDGEDGWEVIDVYAKCSDEILDSEIANDRSTHVNGDPDSADKCSDMERSLVSTDEEPTINSKDGVGDQGSVENLRQPEVVWEKANIVDKQPVSEENLNTASVNTLTTLEISNMIEKPPINKCNKHSATTFYFHKVATKTTDAINNSNIRKSEKTNRRHSIDFSTSNGACIEKADSYDSQHLLRSMSKDSAHYGNEFCTLRRNNSTSLYSLLESRRQQVSKLKGLIIPDKSNDNQRVPQTRNAFPLPTIKSFKPVSVPADNYSSLPRGISLSNHCQSGRSSKKDRRDIYQNQIVAESAATYQIQGTSLPNENATNRFAKSRKTVPNQNGLSASLDALSTKNGDFDLHQMNSGSLQQLKSSKTSTDFSTINFRKTAEMKEKNGSLLKPQPLNSFSNPILTSYESVPTSPSKAPATAKGYDARSHFDTVDATGASSLHRRWNSDIDNAMMDSNHNRYQPARTSFSPKRDKLPQKDLLQQVSDERWMQLERKYASNSHNAAAEKTAFLEANAMSPSAEDPTCKEILLDPQFKPKRLSQQKTVLNNQNISGDSVKSFKALAEQWEQRSLEVGPVASSVTMCNNQVKSYTVTTTTSKGGSSHSRLYADLRFQPNRNLGKPLSAASDGITSVPELSVDDETTLKGNGYKHSDNDSMLAYNINVAKLSSVKRDGTSRGSEAYPMRDSQLGRSESEPVDRSRHHDSNHLITDSCNLPTLLPPRLQEREHQLWNGHLDNVDKSHEIIVVDLQRDIPGGSIGITLAGGADYDSEITVHKIITGSLADRDGRIQKGDRLLYINGHNVENATHRESLQLLKEPTRECVLVLARSCNRLTDVNQDTPSQHVNANSSYSILHNNNRNLTTEIISASSTTTSSISNNKICAVRLLKDASGLGFSLEGGRDSPSGDKPLTVKKLFKGGAADRNGQLKVGDEILFINGIDVSQMSRIEAWQFMKKQPDGLLELIFR